MDSGEIYPIAQAVWDLCDTLRTLACSAEEYHDDPSNKNKAHLRVCLDHAWELVGKSLKQKDEPEEKPDGS